VVLVGKDVSEELSASIIRVTRIGECSSETSVLTRATRCNIPEDGILHSHGCENLKSYKIMPCTNIYLELCNKNLPDPTVTRRKENEYRYIKIVYLGLKLLDLRKNGLMENHKINT
jgi:hypothetical protein